MRKHLLFSALILAITFIFLPGNVKAANTQDMYRLYNPDTGEHFYTANTAEKENLRSTAWYYESIGWTAPTKSNTPVYRLFNKKTGLHHYTTNAAEKDQLAAGGWRYEGIGWYSDDAKTVPVYREYNKKTGQHNFTASAAEDKQLVAAGWKGEGIAWYASGQGKSDSDNDVILLQKRAQMIVGQVYHPVERFGDKVAEDDPVVITDKPQKIPGGMRVHGYATRNPSITCWIVTFLDGNQWGCVDVNLPIKLLVENRPEYGTLHWAKDYLTDWGYAAWGCMEYPLAGKDIGYPKE